MVSLALCQQKEKSSPEKSNSSLLPMFKKLYVKNVQPIMLGVKEILRNPGNYPLGVGSNIVTA